MPAVSGNRISQNRRKGASGVTDLRSSDAATGDEFRQMCYYARSRDFRIASRSMKKAMTRRRLIKLTAAFAASSALAHDVRAQAYPHRIIRLIAPFPAGGGTDSAARAGLSELLGQQVVVDNRPGAGSNIGAEAAARSAPDGYTLLLGAPPLAINRFLYASLNYDSVADLAPVSLLCRF